MPDSTDDYIQALSEARQRVMSSDGVRGEVVAEMRRALAQMLVDIQSDVEAGEITPERAQGLRESIDRALQRFRDQAVVVLEQGRQEAMQQAVEGHRAGLSAIEEQDGLPPGTIAVADSFTDVPSKVLEYGMDRRTIGGAETMETLVSRSVQEAADDIDDTIESAIGRGVSNQRLARDIANQIARGDEALQETLRAMGRGQDVDVDPDAEPETISGEELDRAKRLEYDARRIAISEINSHYHEADVIAAVESDVIDLLRWRTSSQHTTDKRYVPDICDFLEATDVQGYGEGLFHPAAAPSLVHPHCQCRYEKVFKDPEDYGPEMRDLPPETELSDEDVEGVLSDLDGDRTITEKYVQNQRETAQQHLDAARDVANQIMQ